MTVRKEKSMESNQMGIREALVKIRDMIVGGGFDGRSPAYIVNICDAALAEPPRQCDVGTADEQFDRHDKYCNSQPTCRKCLREDAASMCISCFAKWAQMPYTAEEKGK